MKQLSICILSISLSFNVFGQKLSIGPEIGMNLVKVSSGDVNPNYSVGLNQGFKFQYMLNEKLSLSSGVYIDQRFQGYDSSSTILLDDYSPLLAAALNGANLDIPGLSFDVIQTAKGRLSNLYTRIPLLLNIHKEKMNFTIGGYYSYLISSRTNVLRTNRVPLLETLDLGELLGGGTAGNIAAALLPEARTEVENSYRSTDGLNRSDYGLTLGMGYTEEKVGFNIQYSYGFADYRTNPGSIDFKNNSALTISLSYLISVQ